MMRSRLMIIGSPILISFLTFLAIFLGHASHVQASMQKTYDFKVLLDNEEIGSQRFVVSSEEDHTQVHVEAKFDVTFLFFTAYSYRHTNSETWNGDCLKKIRAMTSDNGENFFVRGQYQNGKMELKTQAGQESVEGCVKTFAYWNPDWFQSDRLLNSQTGEVQKVTISKVGKETIAVRGVPTQTEHQRIISDKFTIDLWYTLKREWVALQSTTENGGTLLYQLQ